MRKIIAVALCVVIVALLVLATVGTINWLWFYGAAAVAGLYAWWQSKNVKK
jgi:4-hydroxybenzoate polyprenyltransferase